MDRFPIFKKPINIVIPLAGHGERFIKAGISIPKPLVKVNNKTLLEHSIETLGIEGRYIFITKKYDNPEFNVEITNILKRLKPESIEINTDKTQHGPADSILYAKEYINNDAPLITTNCDQHLDWNLDSFIDFISNENIDGAVVLFNSDNPKNSFAEIQNNKIIKMAEKKVISNKSLIGIHYWKHGKDFVRSAEQLSLEYKDLGMKECYVAETYNYLIKEGKNIYPFIIENNEFSSLGTPEDIEIYLAKIKEFYTEKSKTIFCDIDGTIIKHAHRFSHIGKEDPIALSEVINKFNEWDSKGHKIILTTARKESARYITEKHLNDLGLCWDYLLMGITSGQRILINDKLKSSDQNRAIAINVITDDGFKNIKWEDYNL